MPLQCYETGKSYHSLQTIRAANSFFAINSLGVTETCRRRLSLGVEGGGGKVYSGEWRERVAKLYGNAPQVTYFDTPVIVDNALGGAITKAA